MTAIKRLQSRDCNQETAIKRQSQKEIVREPERDSERARKRKQELAGCKQKGKRKGKEM